jgi:hypothetical protein
MPPCGSDGGRKHIIDPLVLIDAVTQYGINNTAKIYNITYEVCKGRYYRAKGKVKTK